MNIGIIDECVNKGIMSLEASNKLCELGGICGCNRSSTITNCYNAKNINILVKNNYNNCSASGIVENDSDNVKTQNCYTVGEISSNGSLGSCKAAFCLSSSNTTNCYYNRENCSLSDDVATGYTTAEMKDPSFISLLGNSFEADINNINDGYPVLKWQNEE